MDLSQFAPSLTDYEKDIRDRFVDAYLKEFNEVRAAIMIGYSEAYARDYGPRFMREPYVVNRISERRKELGAVTNKDQERQEIVALLKVEARRENSAGGTHAGRVSALVQLSKVLGIEAPAKVEVTDTNPPRLDHLSTGELEEMRRKLYGTASAATITH